MASQRCQRVARVVLILLCVSQIKASPWSRVVLHKYNYKWPLSQDARQQYTDMQTWVAAHLWRAAWLMETHWRRPASDRKDADNTRSDKTRSDMSSTPSSTQTTQPPSQTTSVVTSAISTRISPKNSRTVQPNVSTLWPRTVTFQPGDSTVWSPSSTLTPRPSTIATIHTSTDDRRQTSSLPGWQQVISADPNRHETSDTNSSSQAHSSSRRKTPATVHPNFSTPDAWLLTSYPDDSRNATSSPAVSTTAAPTERVNIYVGIILAVAVLAALLVLAAVLLWSLALLWTGGKELTQSTRRRSSLSRRSQYQRLQGESIAGAPDLQPKQPVKIDTLILTRVSDDVSSPMDSNAFARMKSITVHSAIRRSWDPTSPGSGRSTPETRGGATNIPVQQDLTMGEEGVELQLLAVSRQRIPKVNG